MIQNKMLTIFNPRHLKTKMLKIRMRPRLNKCDHTKAETTINKLTHAFKELKKNIKKLDHV